jgi:hypothetical protein
MKNEVSIDHQKKDIAAFNTEEYVRVACLGVEKYSLRRAEN